MVKQLIDKIKAKLSSASGETLVETLVSALIMGFVMLMLCTAIVAAAKVNAAVDIEDTSFDYAATQEGKTVTSVDMVVTIGDKSLSTGENGKINAFEQNGYYYYEPAN